VGKTSEPPKWIKPQLTRNVDEAPAGDDWLHEIKYDGYRMHARLDRGKVQLLTRTGLDWSRRYPRTIEALRALSVKAAYLDGELCALSPSGGDCLLGTAYPLDVHVATTMGCRLAEAPPSRRSSWPPRRPRHCCTPPWRSRRFRQRK